MIPLPQKTRKNGDDYVQALQGERAAIYSQWYGEILIAYEVMMIKIRPGRSVKGSWVETREKFPNNEDFGYWAWAYLKWKKEAAIEKFKENEMKKY